MLELIRTGEAKAEKKALKLARKRAGSQKRAIVLREKMFKVIAASRKKWAHNLIVWLVHGVLWRLSLLESLSLRDTPICDSINELKKQSDLFDLQHKRAGSFISHLRQQKRKVNLTRHKDRRFLALKYYFLGFFNSRTGRFDIHPCLLPRRMIQSCSVKAKTNLFFCLLQSF